MKPPSDEPGRSGPDWPEFRREMPAAQRWAYFDHAAVSPLSGPAGQALTQWSNDAVVNGDAYYAGWMEAVERTRASAAQMINAHLEEIALVQNTTAGINLVAGGFPWRRGDNIVTRADEFPSNQYPWIQLEDHGVETRRVPTDGGRLDLQRLSDACDDRTRILAISWVAYASGWRHQVDQLAEIAHRHGALLFLDAIQGLGVFPLDVRETAVDFLAADGHKWLLGPEGAGVFFIRRQHLDRLRPLGIGWNSVAHSRDFTRIELVLKESAERYEGGSLNVAGLTALGASLELLARFGAEAISQRVLDITDLACQELQRRGARILSDRRPEHKSGIVTFEWPGHDPQAVRRQCLERGVVLSCRGGGLRISPHAYNDESDIDRLLGALP